MTYATALKYLCSFLNFERLPFEYQRQFNLRRMRCLLDWFGHPERLFPSVLVAGTKGKGSTANFLSFILSANHYRVGLYTSPHLYDARERIRTHGRVISRNDFAALMTKVRPVVERKKREIASLGPITFFEIFTLLAVLYFAQRKVDLGIFEVGMGGRLDATNVLEPLISIITPISFDHEEHLGTHLRSIAKEKTAIIKPAGFVISAKQVKEARDVIEKEIRLRKAKAYFYGRSFRTLSEVLSLKGAKFDFEMGVRHLRNLTIPLPGRVQVQNAALALAATEVLGEHFRFHFRERAIHRGLRVAFWPGRFETVRRAGRLWVLDAAHNGASMSELSSALSTFFPGRQKIVILGTSREKTLPNILKPLLRLSSSLIVTKSNNPRAQEPKIILETTNRMRYRKPTFCTADIQHALRTAEKLGQRKSIFVVTGSLFLVAEAREALKCQKFI